MRDSNNIYFSQVLCVRAPCLLDSYINDLLTWHLTSKSPAWSTSHGLKQDRLNNFEIEGSNNFEIADKTSRFVAAELPADRVENRKTSRSGCQFNLNALIGHQSPPKIPRFDRCPVHCLKCLYNLSAIYVARIRRYLVTFLIEKLSASFLQLTPVKISFTLIIPLKLVVNHNCQFRLNVSRNVAKKSTHAKPYITVFNLNFCILSLEEDRILCSWLRSCNKICWYISRKSATIAIICSRNFRTISTTLSCK